MHHVHHSSRARGTVLSLQTCPPLTRNMNIKVAIELYYIFSKISKFSYWYLFTDAEYIYLIFMLLVRENLEDKVDSLHEIITCHFFDKK